MSELLKEHKAVAALAKNPQFRRLVSKVGVVVNISVGGLLAFLSWVVPWLWLKAVFCYLSAFFLLGLMLRVVFTVLPVRVPSRLLKPGATFLAIWITIAVYFPGLAGPLGISNRQFRLVVAGAIALVFMLPAFLVGNWRFFTEWFFPRLALKDHLKGKSGRWGRTGLVLSRQGIATRYARRLMKEFLTARSFVRSKQQFFLFMTMDSFRRFPSDFQQTAIRSVPALLVVRKAYGDNDIDFRNAVQEAFKASSGLIFDVLIIRPGEELVATNECMGVETIPFVISGAEEERARAREVISVIDERLTKTGIPVGESDDRLHSELRQMISVVATKGFQPLANCYLRFRMSESDVERFLCLLDCIEILIKVSVICLLVNRWEGKTSHDLIQLDAQLNRPSLGIWIDMLRTLIAEAGEDELTQIIRVFWEQRLAGAPRQLISDANGSGLAYEGALPRSHLGWLDWLVWLRNRTRGHGAVAENQVSPLWHGLHKTFLGMTLGLKSLIADSPFAATSHDSSLVPCSGWNRNVQPASDAESQTLLTAEPIFLIRSVGAEHKKLLVYPFIIKIGNAILVWNSVHKNSIEYLDYSTGQMPRVQFDETNPRILRQHWQSRN